MKLYNIAILGATGAVGQTMLKVLEERNFPIGTLKLLASSRSAGKKMVFKGQELTIEEATSDSFKDMHIVLGAAENDIAKKFAQDIVNAGAVFVDNSSAFRLDESVPLVVPEVNGEDVTWHKGIIANPNCVTIIALAAVAPLHQHFGIKRMIASSYQAVSGAGVGGIRELKQQIEAEFKDQEMEIKTFPYQIAYNVIPQIGGFDEVGYTSEEMKLQNEGRKILHAPSMKVSCTCVRIPVFTSHSIAIQMEFEKDVNVELAKKILENSNGIKLMDDPTNKVYPMPLETSDQDLVYVGRIRKDISCDNGLALFCCGDQLRKGAATNAIQIAEELVNRNLL